MQDLIKIDKTDEVFGMDFKSIDEMLDFLEFRMSELPEMMIDCDLDHVFTPCLYSRTIYMPEGALLVSRVHKTAHQFFILKGSAMVFTEGTGWQHMAAGMHGVTVPGTRRVLFITDDCVWSTSHAIGYVTGYENYDGTEKEVVKRIENDILEPSRLKELQEVNE